MTYVVVNKGAGEAYSLDTLEEAAYVAQNDTTTQDLKQLASEIAWSVKRTGRWDRPDSVVVVIEALPADED